MWDHVGEYTMVPLFTLHGIDVPGNAGPDVGPVGSHPDRKETLKVGGSGRPCLPGKPL